MVEPDELERRVRAALEEARDSLARIEMTVRETGDEPGLMAASRAYAQFCMHARDYLGGVQARRPLPRRFAQRLQELRDTLGTHQDTVERLSLKPAPEEVAAMTRLAESAGDVA